MFGFAEVRVYVLDDLLRRLGKDCEVCVYGPAKRRFLTRECCKCIERAERLVHSIIPDENYVHNPEKLDKWLTVRNELENQHQASSRGLPNSNRIRLE